MRDRSRRRLSDWHRLRNRNRRRSGSRSRRHRRRLRRNDSGLLLLDLFGEFLLFLACMLVELLGGCVHVLGLVARVGGHLEHCGRLRVLSFVVGLEGRGCRARVDDREVFMHVGHDHMIRACLVRESRQILIGGEYFGGRFRLPAGL